MKRGREALIAAGFPYEFAATVLQISTLMTISLAVRAGQPPNTDKGYPIAPKPMEMKTKTCSSEQGIPMLAGFIAWDQNLFGREHSKPIDTKKFQSVQLFVSLEELLNDIAQKNYELLHVKDNYLFLKSTSSGVKKNKDFIFAIDLNAKGQTLLEDPDVQSRLSPWKERKSNLKHDFWQGKWGNFSECLKHLYPVFYVTANDDLAPLKVAATKEGLPITGDADLLWVAFPVSYDKEMNLKQYNPKTELDALAFDFYVLSERIATSTPCLFSTENDSSGLLSKCELLEDIISFAKTAGIITPYELLVAKIINDEQKKVITHFSNLFQHGPETNNPGEPSSLEGCILHFYKGSVYLTENEDELIDFVMQKGFLESYYIRVHPGWNMNKWLVVIERQLELGQDILPQTYTKYLEFKNGKSQSELTIIRKPRLTCLRN